MKPKSTNEATVNAHRHNARLTTRDARLTNGKNGKDYNDDDQGCKG